MGTSYIYQQDTVRSLNIINALQKTNELKNFTQRQKPVSIIDTVTRQQVTPPKKTYSPEQIRNWRLRQQNKLNADSSNYISTQQQQVTLNTSKTVEPIILPNRERNQYNTDWLTLIVFLGIIIIASIRYSYAKYLEHLFLSLFNYPTSARMLKENNYSITHAAFRLQTIFYLSFSVFLFQAFNVLKWENAEKGFRYFIMILGAVVLYFLCKKLLYRMIGSLFEAQNETHEFIFNINNYNRVLGVVLLPIIILVSFAPVKSPLSMIVIGAICVAFFNILLLRRGIFILLRKQFSIVYMFLYLCTLEILPLLLIYKVVV